jgi:small neutral amino acid transporter SnatA (MarC family)
MSAEHDDAKKAARQEDLEAEAARQAAEAAAAPHAMPLSAAERAVERLLVTAELIGAPPGFAEKVLAAIRAGKAEGYRRRRWFRLF